MNWAPTTYSTSNFSLCDGSVSSTSHPDDDKERRFVMVRYFADAFMLYIDEDCCGDSRWNDDFAMKMIAYLKQQWRTTWSEAEEESVSTHLSVLLMADASSKLPKHPPLYTAASPDTRLPAKAGRVAALRENILLLQSWSLLWMFCAVHSQKRSRGCFRCLRESIVILLMLYLMLL